MNEQNDLPLGERINRNTNLVMLIASAFAFPSVLLLHRDIGRRYAGPQALLSIVLMFFWPLIDPACDPRPMFWVIGGTLVMSAVARARGLRRKAAGDPVHRFYDGYPRLMRLFRCPDEVLFKRFQEPVIVLFVASAFGVWSPLVAYFGWASAVGLAVAANLVEFAASERVESMRDQYIQQANLVERFRRSNRN